MNKKISFKIIVAIATITMMFGFSGCAQKVQIKAIKASAVSDASIKDIAVAPFDKDDVSQGEQINSALSNVVVNEKPIKTS
jgi:hypothetical protein